MKKKHELMKSHLFENNIPYVQPDKPDELNISTLTSIVNAFEAEAYLDEQGQLWLAKDKLHSILRTTKANANAMFGRFVNKINIEGHMFVRASEVSGKIFQEIEEANSLKKGEYLKFSSQCLTAIRDSDRSVVKRAWYNEKQREEKKKLKSRRIKKYDVTTDELTGERLIKRTAEFSHIRSASLHKSVSLEIENGLIVNKTTHDIITAQEISDEEDLKSLCEINKWSLHWYPSYKKKFGDI